MYTKRFFLVFTVFLLFVACGGPGGSSQDGKDSALLARTVLFPTLNDFWQRRAEFVPSGAGLGSDFRMHFLSVIENDGLLYAYFVNSPLRYGRQHRASTRLARSSDGIHFSDLGEVLAVGGDTVLKLSAENDFEHFVGRADSRCRGWSAAPGDGSGFLAASSRKFSLEQGPYTARFAMALLNTGPNGSLSATLEVFDATVGAVIAQRDLRESDFPGAGTESSFMVEFSQEGGHELELRVFFHGQDEICFSFVGVQVGTPPFRDERIASFPSVIKDDEKWYMVYEGASNDDLGIQGEIRFAESTDGLNWRKHPTPLLIPNAPWQQVNIGTPYLMKHEETWFLFYHGFDGTRLQLGAAAGPSLDSLVPLNNNQPILSNGLDWDSGTIGKRSIVYEEPYYYMVYEGSTAARDFGNAQWGSGLARSTDLIHWEKFEQNPIIGPTPGGFGFDGPEFVQSDDGGLHIYFRNMLGSTDRVTLLFNE